MFTKYLENMAALTEIPTICNISELSKCHKILTSFLLLFSFDEIPMKLKNLLLDARTQSCKPDASDKDTRSYIYRSLYTFLAVGKVFLLVLLYPALQWLFVRIVHLCSG